MFLFTFFILVVVIFGVPMFVVRPITSTLRNRPVPVTGGRFQITDLMALIFLLQVLLGWIYFVMEQQRRSVPVMAVVFCSIIALLVWGAGLSSVNHLGIKAWSKRVLAVGFLFPGAVVSGIGSFSVGAFLYDSIVYEGIESAQSLWSALAACGCVLFVYFLRRLASHLVASSEPDSGVNADKVL